MHTTRAILFSLFAFSLSLPALAAKPNVLMLVVDDWNDWVGAYGHNQAITPNLDKLAARGTLFRQAHTAASFCTPSRTALLTGQAPSTTGCYGNQPHFYDHPQLKTIPGVFKANGYQVFGGGKVFHHMPGYLDLPAYHEVFHWDPAQKQKGWGWAAWDNNPATPKQLPASKIAEVTYEKNDTAAIPNELEEQMADSMLTTWAAQLLTRQHDKPFFMSIGTYAPHKPNYAPQKYFDLYPLDQLKLPDMREEDLADLPPKLRARIANSRKRRIHDPIVANKLERQAVQGYLACLSYADARLGLVLDALERSPHRDNTIVMLWSDNGYHLGEKCVWAKHTLWERTTNVPLIWAGPGIPKNTTYDGAVSLLDVFPTLMDMCDLPAPQKLDGVSLTSIFAKPEVLQDRTVIVSDAHGFSAVNDRWHYNRYSTGDEELYDVLNDPKQWTNQAANPELAGVKTALAARIPANPAPPAADHKLLRRVYTGETFEWVKKAPGAKGSGKDKGKKKPRSRRIGDGARAPAERSAGE